MLSLFVDLYMGICWMLVLSGWVRYCWSWEGHCQMSVWSKAQQYSCILQWVLFASIVVVKLLMLLTVISFEQLTIISFILNFLV